MSKGIEALHDLYDTMAIAFMETNSVKYFEIIEKELQMLEFLKEICLEGKDKYGKGTWGWVEFNLDEEPKLKEWLKDDLCI